MALSAAIEFDVRSTGNDANGGGFKAGATGTDYSQQNAAQVALDGAVIYATAGGASSTVTLNGVTGLAAHVGNVVQFTGGTNVTAGFYEITGYTAGSWTVDRNWCTGAVTDGAGNMGGALASPGKACGAATVNFQTIHIKSGTYAIAAGAANVSGQRLAPTARIAIIGFATTHRDGGAAPVLQASASLSAAIITNGASGVIIVRNVECDGNSQAATRGFDANSVTSTQFVHCTARNCTNSGFFGGGLAYCCLATGCATAGYGFSVASAVGCRATANSVIGFVVTSATNCTSDNNTGATTDGFEISGTTPNAFTACVAYANGRHGWGGDARGSLFASCISYGNTGYGWSFSTADYPSIVFESCAQGSNGSGATTGAAAAQNVDAMVTLTGDPFTNGAANDFTLNNTAGAGAACRSVGWPGAVGLMAADGYADIGAYRHQDPAGGGGGSSGSAFRGAFG